MRGPMALIECQEKQWLNIAKGEKNWRKVETDSMVIESKWKIGNNSKLSWNLFWEKNSKEKPFCVDESRKKKKSTSLRESPIQKASLLHGRTPTLKRFIIW
ncbi:hypothetical protein NE237_018008 [Protea cynaroides]|uniref:Uncharacterized protein n=1 Tax=Protea cynaroides TaxID=273540 RepID=A0A9Q0K956_9MAGN|nr:hypothetical protein NE237_018008 [Protea cynaroides]